MVRPAIQLYTLRNVDRPVTELLEIVADAGFEGVEFAYRVAEADPDDVVDTLDDAGLEVAGAHIGVDALEGELDESIAFYDALGCEDIVIPSIDAKYFESREGVADAADRLDEIDAHLADRGKTMHYHNHDHEYASLNGETGFDAFVEATEFPIELDVGFALSAGDDPVARLRSLGDRSRLVHLKDVVLETGKGVPVGEGDLDLPAIAEAAHSVDTDWLIYEYEGDDPLASLNEAAEITRGLC